MSKPAFKFRYVHHLMNWTGSGRRSGKGGEQAFDDATARETRRRPTAHSSPTVQLRRNGHQDDARESRSPPVAGSQ